MPQRRQVLGKGAHQNQILFVAFGIEIFVVGDQRAQKMLPHAQNNANHQTIATAFCFIHPHGFAFFVVGVGQEFGRFGGGGVALLQKGRGSRDNAPGFWHV